MITWKEFIDQTLENTINELLDRKNYATPWIYASTWEVFEERIKDSLEDPYDDVEEKDVLLIESLTDDLLNDLRPYVKRWVDSYKEDNTELFDEWISNFWRVN